MQWLLELSCSILGWWLLVKRGWTITISLKQRKCSQDTFRLHLEAARECGKPVIVHTREAKRRLPLDLLREAALPQAGVMHCFTEELGRWRKLHWIWVITFPFLELSLFRNADALREVALQVPSDRILVETDSPYWHPSHTADGQTFLSM